MDSIISVKGVDLTIGKTQILKDISVEFEEGRIHGLIGRNGSGKTMLMKCICGFIKVSKGEITVDGKRVGKDVDFPKDMGIIIETPGFIPYYSGYKNLKLLAGLNNKIGKEQVRESMKQVGLDPDLRRHVRGREDEEQREADGGREYGRKEGVEHRVAEDGAGLRALPELC